METRARRSRFSPRRTRYSTHGWAISILGAPTLEAGAFTQADSEFDRCITRRGEALSLLLDEEPTYALFGARLLLPGSCPRRAEDSGLCRVVPRLPDSPRPIQGRPATRRSPPARRRRLDCISLPRSPLHLRGPRPAVTVIETVPDTELLLICTVASALQTPSFAV